MTPKSLSKKKTNKPDWEREFDGRFGYLKHTVTEGEYDFEQLKSFITEILCHQRKEILKKINTINKDFDSKLTDSVNVGEACRSLDIENTWNTEIFTAKIGKEMFYKYLRQKLYALREKEEK